MHARSIPLVTGDPEADRPASFVRFVLPFAYQRVAAPAGDGGCRFEARAVGCGRRGYLTAETDSVLFDRAGWFELADDGWAPPRFSVPHVVASGRFTVEIRRPRLVLFEWARREEADGEDPLATGFLLLDAWFPEAGRAGPDLDDLFRFQELFRHWREPFANHDELKGLSEALGECPARFPTSAERLAEVPRAERYGGRWLPLLDLPVRDEAGAWALWPQESALGRPESAGYDPRRFPYADPRAFVWSCALVEGGAHAVAERFGAEPPHRHLGHWIKLLNVDPPGATPTASAESTPFEREWADARTYRRWEHTGSLYGFAYHGGAMLAPLLEEPPAWRHWSGHYFDQTLLLLYLRVTSFRFSRRLTEATAGARGGRREEAAWRRDFASLRRDFALFTNLYEFPLVSNQQQAIEMYALAREHLDVEELFREVEQEIASSHEYFENQASQLQARATAVLTLLATIGLPLALVTGFFGMNVLAEELEAWSVWGPGGLVVFVTLLVVGLFSLGLVMLMRVGEGLTDWMDRLSQRGGRRRRRRR